MGRLAGFIFACFWVINACAAAPVLDTEQELAAAKAAIVDDDIKAFKSLVRHETDANRTLTGVPLAWFALRFGRMAHLEHLLELGADPDARTASGMPLITSSIGFESPKGMTALLKAGADIEAESGIRRVWPLGVAVRRRNADFVRILLKHGADPNRQRKSGSTVLHDAVQNEDEEIVQLLISRGANPTLETNRGMSVLEMAQRRKVEHWLEAKGDQND